MIASQAGKPPSTPPTPAPPKPADTGEAGTRTRRQAHDEPDDDADLFDPFLTDAIPEPSDLGGDADDIRGVGFDVPDELLPEPSDLNATEDSLGTEVADDFGFSDNETLSDGDDDQGPSTGFAWEALDDLAESGEEDDAADGPLESASTTIEPLQPLRSETESDEEDMISEGMPEVLADDTEITWARERWAELPLPSAYSARQHLALVGNTLCAAGERTHLIGSRDLLAIESAPVHTTMQRVLCLDSEPSRLLLLANSGHLLLWNRGNKAGEALRRIAVPNGEVVSLMWQLAPGVPRILFRLESGRTLHWDDPTETLLPAQPQTRDDRWRLRALSEIGEPRVSLWQGPSGARLRVEVGASARDIPLSASLGQVVQGSRPLLAGYVDHVLCGVRDHGLFLHGPGAPQFVMVPGCRRITALAAGHLLGKPIAFVGLFSELDDRAEVAFVDLASGRSTRIAEVTIHTDDDGPADDPPERARIDSLLWDPAQSRLWAAGCFGLTCFQPPTAKLVSAARKKPDQ